MKITKKFESNFDMEFGVSYFISHLVKVLKLITFLTIFATNGVSAFGNFEDQSVDEFSTILGRTKLNRAMSDFRNVYLAKDGVIAGGVFNNLCECRTKLLSKAIIEEAEINVKGWVHVITSNSDLNPWDYHVAPLIEANGQYRVADSMYGYLSIEDWGDRLFGANNRSGKTFLLNGKGTQPNAPPFNSEIFSFDSYKRDTRFVNHVNSIKHQEMIYEDPERLTDIANLKIAAAHYADKKAGDPLLLNWESNERAIRAIANGCP